jgi:hypothetical protein
MRFLSCVAAGGLVVLLLFRTADSAEAPLGVAIHAGTLITVQIDETLSSRTSKAGDRFVLSLAEPVVVDGRAILPAGTPGFGEVAHADHAGGGGKAGELVVVARYLETGGTRVPIGHLKIAPVGADRFDNPELAATLPRYAGVRGNEAVVPAGTRAQARVTADVSVVQSR